MSADDLLLWMSARVKGSWQQFRAAVENLHLAGAADDSDEGSRVGRASSLPAYQLLRLNLERLGHAEFFDAAGDDEWRVTPPTLAAISTDGGVLGFLAGARSDNLMAKLQDAAHGEQLEMRTLPACPKRILIRAADTITLAGVAEEAGLLLQEDAPASILSCLPPIDDPAWGQPAELPFGSDWKIDRFSVSRLAWRPASLDAANASQGGVFRFTFRHQKHVLYCSRGFASRVSSAVGKFRTLRRRRIYVIRYDPETKYLRMPASCRPPLLIERALVLCSGGLPAYQRGERGPGTLQYPCIPQPIARMVAARLLQSIW